MTLDELLARGEAMHEELGREWYRAGAGLTDDPQFQAIYDRYDDLQSEDVVDVATASGEATVLEWVIDVRIGRQVASFEERQMRWEQQARIDVDGRSIPYLRVPIEIANADDRDLRIVLDRARSRAAGKQVVPIRRERFLVERDLLLRHSGEDDYVAGLAVLTGIDFDGLGAAAREFLTATEDMYVECLEQYVKKYLGVPLGDLVRSDALWLFRIDRYDAAFPENRMISTAVRQMAEMQLDARQGGRIHLDTEDREGKQPRAFCVPVRVPEEVYLVLQPSGGHGDYRTFWHELGHAMHFAAVDPDLPFTARWLGDNSVTEGFAMLWDHLTITPRWLDRYAEIGTADRKALTFELAVSELFMARRYAAKINYELEFHRGDFEVIGPRYAEWLSEATRFRYHEDDAVLDVDPGFYSARYLRAWQLEAALSGMLGQRFDEEWFRRPEAGEVVLGLMRQGQAMPADALALHATGEPLSFAAVATRLEQQLSL